jgi:hypothetical protein
MLLRGCCFSCRARKLPTPWRVEKVNFLKFETQGPRKDTETCHGYFWSVMEAHSSHFWYVHEASKAQAYLMCLCDF